MGNEFGRLADTKRVATVKVKLASGKTVRIKLDPGPIITGNFSDLYTGYEQSLKKVALKRCRTSFRITQASMDQKDVISKEAGMWQKLSHPNILQFHGVGRDKAGFLYLVSPWMENHSLVDFIQRNPGCNRPRFLKETAEALIYLHRSKFIHGDVKAENILVSPAQHALLCDFGLSKAVDSITQAGYKNLGSLPFQAPELWAGATRKESSDIYAFGMTIYQVLSGRRPFDECDSHAGLIGAVSNGQRPPRDPSVSLAGHSYDYVWGVAADCWKQEPSERLSLADAKQRLEEGMANPRRVPPPTRKPTGTSQKTHTSLEKASQTGTSPSSSEDSSSLHQPVELPGVLTSKDRDAPSEPESLGG